MMQQQQQQQQQQQERQDHDDLHHGDSALALALALPPAYTQHEPESLHLPSVPTHAPASSVHSLPGIRSLDLTPRHTPTSSIELSPRSQYDAQWGQFPSLHGAMVGSPMDTASVLSAHDDSRAARRDTSVSMDDPDVRLAAEALSGLGNLDFVRSPTAPSAEPEPLLSLITSNHPWLGGTIHGSISAYNATKGYSPRFVKYGAELIERNVGSPMVNTVSSVSRRTGMEQNLRRYLGEVGRRPSDLEQGDADAARKRPRVESPATDAMDVDSLSAASRRRRGSHSSCAESLPAYDDQRSPSYSEAPTLAAKEEAQQDRRVPWSTQLIMTTSGLGVALSAASLRSLKLCLSLLRGATTHIDNVMQALRLVLQEYEAALRNQNQQTQWDTEKQPAAGTAPTSQEDEVNRIASRIKALSADIWQTLQSVVASVSRYTGGALPQNASQVVRTQLLSVPQRWQLAGQTTRGEDGRGDEVRGAKRMLAFAKEGLDMMGQITTVVDGTVQSAENWLGRIGRRPEEVHEGEKTPGGGHVVVAEKR